MQLMKIQYRNEGRYNSAHVKASRLLLNYKYLNLYIWHLKPAKFTLYIINIPLNHIPYSRREALLSKALFGDNLDL